MFSIKTFHFSLLCFFLSYFGFLFRILLDIGLELSDPIKLAVSKQANLLGNLKYILFRCNNFPFNCFLIIRSPTGRTEAVDIVFNIVEAELTYLKRCVLAYD